MKKLITVVVMVSLAILNSFVTRAQLKYKNSSSDLFQYGFSLKLTAGFEHGCLMLRAAAVCGIGAEILTVLYPSYHLQLQLYNGGIGTSLRSPKAKIYLDLSQSLTITAGGRRPYRYMSAEKYFNRNSPLYHFSDFSYPALQNPFQYSLSLGTNLIHAFGSNRSKFQRAGFFNAHVGIIQFAYSNDGTPFGKCLADGMDRHYTGDGLIAINLPRKYEINNYTLSYHKFTGYSDSSFEVSNSLYLANVDYKDTVQQLFNRSIYSFTASSLDRGVALSLDFRNSYFLDVQHLIHSNDYWVLHQMPYPFRKSITASVFSGTSNIKPRR